jgi:hypothetical protein
MESINHEYFNFYALIIALCGDCSILTQQRNPVEMTQILSENKKIRCLLFLLATHVVAPIQAMFICKHCQKDL